MHIRKRSSHFFWKLIDLSIEYAIHIMTEACLWEWRVSGIFIRRSRIFQKKSVSGRESMGCMMRTYFRGNWQSQGGVRSTTKCSHCERGRCPRRYNNLLNVYTKLTTNYGFLTGSYYKITMRSVYDNYMNHIPCLFFLLSISKEH